MMNVNAEDNAMPSQNAKAKHAPIRYGASRVRHSSFITHHSSISSAFTVTELLIVIGIIVLVLAMAMPAFNFITGSKSTQQAGNQIGAFLGRARNEAIGLQETRGVMFYIDPKTKGITLALVRQTTAPTAGALSVDVYLDLTDDSDTLALPRGVGIEMVDDAHAMGTPAVRADDGYIGFNTVNANPLGAAATEVPYGGMILFDSRGQLTSRSYAMKVSSNVNQYTPMGVLLYQPPDPAVPPPSAHQDVVPVDPGKPANASRVLRSQFGFVLFESEAFKNLFGGDGPTGAFTDLQVRSPSANYPGTDESKKEDWLDANATPILINRYNGTLVRGE